MKRFAITLGVVFTIGCTLGGSAASAVTGNGAPSGPHFTLNIHGVSNGQGFNGNNQNNIFVPLNGTCKIMLEQAFTYDFQVLQPDCVSTPNTAEFELPAPCAIEAGLCSSSTTIYSVYARAGQAGRRIEHDALLHRHHGNVLLDVQIRRGAGHRAEQVHQRDLQPTVHHAVP